MQITPSINNKENNTQTFLGNSKYIIEKYTQRVFFLANNRPLYYYPAHWSGVATSRQPCRSGKVAHRLQPRAPVALEGLEEFMKGDTKVIEYLNAVLKNELTAEPLAK